MSLFTIEQYELIRRLRETGISREQLVEAYGQFDQLETSLHSFVGHHATTSPSSTTVRSPLFPVPQILPPTAPQHQAQGGGAPPSSRSSRPSLAVSTHTKRLHSSGPLRHGGSSTQPREATKATSRPSTSAPQGSAVDSDYGYILHQNYLATASSMLKTVAAAAPGGEGLAGDMLPGSGAGTMAALARKHQAGLASAAKAPNSADYSGDPKAPLKTRSRFIFKKAHIAVLDHFFKQNPYPDSFQRCQLADDCNAASTGSVTSANGVRHPASVTPAMVHNWFSNRRKAVKPELRKPRRKPLWSGASSHMTGNVLLPPSEVVYQSDGAMVLSEGGASADGTPSTSAAEQMRDDWASRMLYDISTSSTAPPCSSGLQPGSPPSSESQPGGTVKMEAEEERATEPLEEGE